MRRYYCLNCNERIVTTGDDIWHALGKLAAPELGSATACEPGGWHEPRNQGERVNGRDGI